MPWSSEEARRFLESDRHDDDSFYTAFVPVLVLGLRKGEVLGLSWPAVDVQERELTIDQQLQRVRRELLLRQTKTAASPTLCRGSLPGSMSTKATYRLNGRDC